MKRRQVREEPYDGKLSRTVLEPSRGGDAPAQVNSLTNLIAPVDFNTGDPRFVTAFTDNRSGCDFRTTWTADMHVGSAVIQ